MRNLKGGEQKILCNINRLIEAQPLTVLTRATTEPAYLLCRCMHFIRRAQRSLIVLLGTMQVFSVSLFDDLENHLECAAEKVEKATQSVAGGDLFFCITRATNRAAQYGALRRMRHVRWAASFALAYRTITHVPQPS